MTTTLKQLVAGTAIIAALVACDHSPISLTYPERGSHGFAELRTDPTGLMEHALESGEKDTVAERLACALAAVQILQDRDAGWVPGRLRLAELSLIRAQRELMGGLEADAENSLKSGLAQLDDARSRLETALAAAENADSDTIGPAEGQGQDVRREGEIIHVRAHPDDAHSLTSIRNASSHQESGQNSRGSQAQQVPDKKAPEVCVL